MATPRRPDPAEPASPMPPAQQALRFLLELAALAALAYWGAHAGQTRTSAAVLAVLAPLGAALSWGACVSPRARIALPAAGRLAVELGLFAAAVAGLAAIGATRWAWMLGGAVLLHEGLRLAAHRHRRADRPGAR